MPGNRTDIRSLLDAWREQGADRVDPVRFGVLAALEHRAHRYDGPVVQLLQERLAVLTAEYASALAETAKREPTGNSPNPLRKLLDHIAASAMTAEPSPEAEEAGAAPVSPMPQLPSLDEFQRLWGRIRTDSQLRQSLAPVPEGAGPLHSSALLHRAMTLMHEASPGYLQHFIAYVDALSWMEQLQGDGVLETHATSRSADAKAAGKPRARKRAKPR